MPAPWLVTTAWPSAASVGASTTADDHRLLDAELTEDGRRCQSAERNRQWQPDAEQPRWDVRVAAQLAQIDPRGVGE